MNGTITKEKLISHYYLLPPWQSADEEMLRDIEEIKDSYPQNVLSKLTDVIRNNFINYSFREDGQTRRKYFRSKINEAEEKILQSYYERQGLDIDIELKMRASRF